MKTETVIIPKKEYTKLKQEAELNTDLIEQLISSLEDVKAGGLKRVI